MNVSDDWLASMRLKFEIRHFLLTMLFVSIGLFLHLSLSNVTSTLENDVGNIESPLHEIAKQELLNEFPSIMATASRMSVDNLTFDAAPTIPDYCLFRRTIQCRYNLNVDYLRREIAHSKIPQDKRVDEHYVDVPSRHQAQESVCVTATPFGYRIKNQ